MKTASLAWLGAMMLGGVLAGCASTGGETPPAASLATPAPAGAPAPVARGPFLDGPVGLKLAEVDRDAAFKAETEALSSGNRKTWRGQKGTYGFVVLETAPGAAPPPGGPAGAGECLAFSHTIYFAGRPQTGHGTGCREPDGSWRITG